MKIISNRKTYILGTVLLLLIALAGLVINKHLNKPAASQHIPYVRTQVIALTANKNIFTYSGEVRGQYESQLAFQTGGKIIKRNIDLGDVVKQGDILMTIDPKDIQQNVNIAVANVQAAESQLKLAHDNLVRFKKLYEVNAVSKADYDRYQSAYETAQAALNQAYARNSQAANQLEYTCLRANSAGVVASVDAEIGQVVAAGQRVVTLVKSGNWEIEINIPENRLKEVRNAQQIKVSFWAFPNLSLDGKVREIAPAADKISRTYKVRISLINPPAEIKLGMTASVEILNTANSAQATAYIPLTAVYQTQDTPAVWIVNNETVSLRQIKIGSFLDNQVEVLEGLSTGDVIVTAGVHKLWEGQKVRIAAGDTK